MADFLLEIGTEEIPAGMIQSLAVELSDRVSRVLESQGLPCGKRRLVAAPRRIGFFAQGLPERQEDRRETVVGPALAIARGADGAWTKAAEGFAKKQGAAPDDLKEVAGPKGPCVGFEREVAGRPTAQILGEVVPAAVDALYLPKAMRWGNGDALFVRPVRWVVALLDAEVVPLAVKGVASGRASRGRRVFGSEHVEIARAGDYFERLEDEFVVSDPESRKASIAKQLGESALSVGGHCPEDPELLETVASLCEGGFVLVGDIPAKFLELPTEVMRTCLREHQKFFVVVDADGRSAAALPLGRGLARGPQGIHPPGQRERDRGPAHGRRVLLRPRQGRGAGKAPRRAQGHRLTTPSWGPTTTRRSGLRGTPAIWLRRSGPTRRRLRVRETVQVRPGLPPRPGEGVHGPPGRRRGAVRRGPGRGARGGAGHQGALRPGGFRLPRVPGGGARRTSSTRWWRFFRIGQAPTGSKDPFALRRAAIGCGGHPLRPGPGPSAWTSAPASRRGRASGTEAPGAVHRRSGPSQVGERGSRLR